MVILIFTGIPPTVIITFVISENSDAEASMSDIAAFPSYPEGHLAGLEPAAFMDLMLAEDLAERPWPEEEPHGAWWLRLHAVMILGLIPSERASLLLVRLMQRMAEAGDNNLQDWLSGDWPALFANKPAAALPALRELCADRGLDWYIRADAMDTLVASAKRGGPEALDAALAWVARLAADEQEDWDMRLSCGDILLDFPRPQYRALEGTGRLRHAPLQRGRQAGLCDARRRPRLARARRSMGVLPARGHRRAPGALRARSRSTSGGRGKPASSRLFGRRKRGCRSASARRSTLTPTTTEDLPERGLVRGRVGTVVEELPPDAYEAQSRPRAPHEAMEGWRYWVAMAQCSD